METSAPGDSGKQSTASTGGPFLFLSAVLILSVGLASYGYELRLPALGFRWTNAHLVYAVEKGGPAERAGVRAGDVFSQLEGVTPDHPLDMARMLRRLPAGKAVSLVVEREGQPLELTLLPESRSPFLEGWGVNYVVALVFWAMGLFVYRQRAGDRVARFHLFFSLTSALVFFTLLPGLTWFRILQYVGLGLVPGLFLHLFSALADEFSQTATAGEGKAGVKPLAVSRRPLLLVCFYLPGVLLGLWNSTLILLGQERAFAWVYDLLPLNLAFGFVEWLVLLFIYLRVVPMGARRELEETAVGIFIATLPFIVLLLIDTLTRSQFIDSRILHLASLGLPLALSQALLKGYMTNLDRLVNQGLVYTILGVVLLGLYLLLVEIGGHLLSVPLSTQGVLISAFATLVVVILSAPLKRWLQWVVNRLFYQ